MNIERTTETIGAAQTSINHCLSQLDKAHKFNHGLDWDTEIVHNLTLRELIGALIAAAPHIHPQNQCAPPFKPGLGPIRLR